MIWAFSEFFAYLSEAFLLWFTTDNIDYRGYLNFLAEGIRNRKFIFKMSLFLVHSPKTIPDYEEESTDWRILDRTEDENVRARMTLYNQESRTTFQISGELKFAVENSPNLERTPFLPQKNTMSKQSIGQISTDA